MSLPALTTLQDCTSLSKTVVPFLPHLSLTHFLPLLRGQVAPAAWYLSTNPLMSGLAFALLLSAVVLIVSEVNGNYSQVDRLWSLLPTAYIGNYAVYAHLAGLPSQRLDVLVAFSALWSARLTFNYWRRGGYDIGSEDYRWKVVQAHLPKWGFFILNVVFISFWQNILLFLIATPAYLLLLTSTLPPAAAQPAWSLPDLLLSHALVLALLVELVADQQQWNFQRAKHEHLSTGTAPQGYHRPYLARGFVVTGLWSLCRHPNFVAEQAIWALVYLWGCLVTDGLCNWTAVGVVSYLALFQGSVTLTERISAGKYPEYREYQRIVSRFVPGFGAFTRVGVVWGKGE